MTTKLIAALLLAAALFVGWRLLLYWDQVKSEEEVAQKKAAASAVVPEQLQGMPSALEPVLQAAQRQGAAGMTNFLKNYSRALSDPRKAWIELDYALLLSRENTAEAKKIYEAVKQRTPPSSPVYARVKELARTYE